MIWHIFKKDWKLLWRLVVGVALVHFALAVVMFKLGHFGNRALGSLINPLIMIASIGTGFLIAAIVHQDTLPGVRQDWLVRPVKRRDLLLAKLLFVLVMVHGPILAADLMHALADGFPFSEAFASTVSRSAYIFVGFSLPLLALASLTRNLMEGIVGGLAVFMGGMLFVMMFQGRESFVVTIGTGVAWVKVSAWLALSLFGTTAVLVLQYFRRKTMAARCLMGTVAFLCLCTTLIPWQSAFAIQQQRSPSPGSGSAVAITFDPGQGKLRRTGRINYDDLTNRRNRASEGDVFVYIPLRIAGLSGDSVLKADHSEVRLTGHDDQATTVGYNLEIRGERQTYHGFQMSGDIFVRIKDLPIRLEIDYSLTLFHLAASNALPALNGDQRMPNVGWCKTNVNQSGTNVQIRCLQAGERPSCGTWFLEHAPSGRRNPERPFCTPDYSPYLRRDFPDAMGRFGMTLPFFDPSGLAQYPVDGSQLAESQVVLRVYEPVDHFTRRLMIPEIRLKDWESALGF